MYNRMVNDIDAHEVYKYSVEANYVVHIYVEHNVKGFNGVNFEEDIVDDVENNVEEDEVKDVGNNVEEYEVTNVGNNVEEHEHKGSSSGVDNEMDTNYASDELGGSDPDASDEEKEPKYPRFKMEELDKNYKFKGGLEFGSLD
ncbi:hypothetical protein KIW84_024322 [Lathyrus oleraceus]|uniref:Uncharacterized protein n=1 Tax=Pisum sativum TaxID=3888 RepID=A0A9D4YJV9_PEA|nr:hypothetical protein KIW84_024322 [Pisum sativum]